MSDAATTDRELLRELVQAVGITPEERKQYYDIFKYADHKETCARPRGDQGCQCGFSAVSWNIDTLLDECEGYRGYAAIDKARAALASVPAPCTWRYDTDTESYDTACGDKHILIEGTPAENGMRYCCYCGLRMGDDDA